MTKLQEVTSVGSVFQAKAVTCVVFLTMMDISEVILTKSIDPASLITPEAVSRHKVSKQEAHFFLLPRFPPPL